MNKKMKNTIYYLMLILGFFAQTLPGRMNLSWGSGIATLLWIFAFLMLSCIYQNKKEILLTGAVFILSFVVKFSGTLGHSLLSYVLYMLFGGIIYGLFVISGYLVKKLDRFYGTFALPILWLLGYFVTTLLSVPAVFRIDILFSDMNSLLIIERYIGTYGFTFLILWIISLVCSSIVKKKEYYAIVALILLALMILPGVSSLAINVSDTQTVRIAYTTGPYIGDFTDYGEVDYSTNEMSLIQSVESAASQQAEMLVFNEEAFELDDKEEEQFIHKCSDLAKANSLALLVGLDITDTDNSEEGQSINKLVLIDARGEVLSSYIKSQLFPFFESNYVRGDGIIPSNTMILNGQEVKVSYLICYDSNFSEYVKKIDDDTDILFLPSWDWKEVTNLHAKVVQTMAIENNVYILKPTYDGLSIAVDSDGRIFSSSSTEVTGYESVQIVDMPIKSSAKIAAAPVKTGFTYAIIATEVLSVMICILLLLGNEINQTQRTKRSYIFSWIIATSIFATSADALSWFFDGYSRLTMLLEITTYISIMGTFVLMWEFVVYITEYIRERTQVSKIPLVVMSIYTIGAMLATLILNLHDGIFYFDQGFYVECSQYQIYLVINSVETLLCLLIILSYHKVMYFHDRLIAYCYVAIPIFSEIINMFVEEWSFAYPSITLSLMMVYVMIQSDKVDRLEHEGRVVSYYATHDELTGLHNRRAFTDRYTMISESEGNSGIIYADVNGLKYTNDHYGHDGGDRLLTRFSTVLLALFRTNEIYRISGDEFICMMENVSEETFQKRLDALKDALKQDEIPLASIGSAFGANKTVKELVKNAETEMYEEKEKFYVQFPEMKR